MKHSEVIAKWIGKWYAETPQLWFQCVWWAKKYCEERGYPIKSFWGSAWNGWVTWKPFDDSWVRFPYKPWMFPKQWDLIFWSEDRCKNWHVSVASKHCNPNLLRHTDQNWTGKQDKIQPRFSDYKHVIWFYSKLWN